MVNLNLAYTAPVNPSGASPALTRYLSHAIEFLTMLWPDLQSCPNQLTTLRDQLWQGLERKVRKAQEFVPAITGCDVVKEENNVVERNVTFKDGMGHDGQTIREVCKLYKPAKVLSRDCFKLHLLSNTYRSTSTATMAAW